MSDSDIIHDHALLDITETSRIAAGLSEATILRRVKAGTFPPPVVVARTKSGRPCRRAWVRGEVLAWCRRSIAADRGHAA
jgi:predicted DNA-binding transcriptional regulator AlpA